MNKTITSNIAGIVFHIDENAFHKLEQYLKNIRNYFAGSEGEDDIVSGIEERIADMFQARLKDGKSVVTMVEVDEVIAIMGQPEAFMDGEDMDEQPKASAKAKSTNKRIFRDPDNRVVGGVCSGISHYLGITDPVWLRLALLLAVVFAGTGILLYIILWIVIPSAKTPTEKLEMKGENVNVENIGKTVNAEFEALRNKWDNSSVGGNGAVRQISDFLVRAITLVAHILLSIVKFIAKLLGLMFLLFGAFAFMELLP
jgi:phage shock protein PspC (stress-responsive transcriptional regulator)